MCCCCSKKKNERQKLLTSKQTIEDNANQINILKDYVSGEPELVSLLDEIQDTLKYLNPTVNEDAVKLDKKIKDKIDDAKIIFSKSDKKEDYSKTYDIIKELKHLAVERQNVRQG